MFEKRCVPGLSNGSLVRRWRSHGFVYMHLRRILPARLARHDIDLNNGSYFTIMSYTQPKLIETFFFNKKYMRIGTILK